VSPRWSEATNRQLRALLWKGLRLPEIAFRLGRPGDEVLAQMRVLRLAS
jgi:hypothetical protein